jgi:hypothetical protein
MKHKRLLLLFTSLLGLLFLFNSCAKDPNEPEEEETPIAPPMKFNWTVSGGTSVSAADAYYVPSYNEIVATKSGVTAIDIILDALNKGTYNVSPSNGITLKYNDGTSTYNAKSGTVVITENNETTITGTFNCVLNVNGATSSITGEFANIPKK